MTITQQALAKIQPPPGAPASAWAVRISACWQASVKAILEVGRLLSEAKEALPHGAFGVMIESNLPFTSRTAQMLMAISADSRLTNPKHVSLLPPAWGTLYELTKLDDEQFEARVADQTIRPEMDRRDISGVIKQTARANRERDLGIKQRELPGGQFGIVFADPAWRFGPYSRMTGMDRAPDNHYPTMTLPQIMRLPVKDIAAKDSGLFLWTTSAMLIEALYVAEAWGFLDLGDRAERAALMAGGDEIDWTRKGVGDPNARYKSQQIWRKIYPGEMLGTGYWYRNEHEALLVFTRGNLPAPAQGTQDRSVRDFPVGKHSAKPEHFLAEIDRHWPTLLKIELNRRGPPRPGWVAWGNEVDTDTRSPMTDDSTSKHSPSLEPNTLADTQKGRPGDSQQSLTPNSVEKDSGGNGTPGRPSLEGEPASVVVTGVGSLSSSWVLV